MASEDFPDDCAAVACFCKIILEPRLDLRKLEIPKKFIATHGSDLSDVVYLNIPSGEVCKCQLVRKKGKTLLKKGWPKFVKYYSLSHGHFLVFKYHGKSRFTVIICSMTASEIDYPYGNDDEEEEEEEDDNDHNDHPQESWESLPTQGKSTDTFVNDDLSDEGEEVTIDEEYKGVIIVGRNSCLTSDARKLIESYAQQFKHPSFAAGILPSSVLDKFSVAIPNEFRRRYLDVKTGDNVCIINLKTNNSSEYWPVKILNGASYSSMKLGKGWKQFARDNMITVGEICIFELVNKRLFKVAIIGSDKLLR